MRIINFAIQNFRSLKNLKIENFSETTIFYGENNAGKSNILYALYLIFKRKSKSGQGKDDFSQAENFYEGVIFDSRNNFFNKNYKDPITFQVEIEFNISELEIDQSIKSLFKSKTEVTFKIEGQIELPNLEDHSLSEILINTIDLGSITIYSNSNGKIAYFPSVDKTNKNQSELSQAFTKLIDPLNDCIYIINSDRDMLETEMKVDVVTEITSKTFKSFLYNLYLSTSQYKTFEQIDEVFSKPPFSFGNISFSKEGENLEIMIKENDFRLPIKHLGSGVLQTLFIIASIIYSKRKIICIEELEQNLSPQKQYQILTKIKSMIGNGGSNILSQIVISSHSSVYSKPKLGTIYFLEKKNGETIINKKEPQKISKKLIKHLSPSLYVETYSPEEWIKNFEEIESMVRNIHDLK